MKERVCKNCGGRAYKVVGQNMTKCKFCGTLYVDEYASKEEEVLLVGAYEKLRECNFSDAIEEFNKILTLYPMSFEANFGKMLAKNKIVYYTNKRGTSQKPRFFGDEIPSVVEDENYKKALELAPTETAQTYQDKVKRIEKLHKGYEEQAKNQNYDILVCALDVDKDNNEDVVVKMVEEFRKDGRKVYFLQGLSQREKEEETFRALKTCKAFVFVVNSSIGFADQEVRNLYERYFYMISQKKKTKSSLVLVLDENKVNVAEMPKDLVSCKSVIDLNSISFLQDIKVKVEKEMSKTFNETAKIETVKIEKVDPKKKEYVDVETVNPSELGHYHVDNLSPSEENKIKWIFLSLKHGDFVSAEEMLKNELQKDPNNAELLYAELMLSLKVKIQDEFFANISNFKDKEKIDKILSFASKDFAEYFVDRWEKLIVELDEEEYYNAYLLYLAKFTSPYRDEFVSKAEEKAVETLNDELIEKVLKCFNQNEVERFVNFYFSLAQKSDKQEYYDKVLSIDVGHEQSNLAMLLQNFKTDEDKLNYKNREQIEEAFKYLGEDTRAQFVSAVVNMILPLAFHDIDKAENQLDFYLSYVADTSKLVAILKNIALKMQEYGFFKQAEKYISIAISKDSSQSELYWWLIIIKLHCKSDNELILSKAKITQMPEWDTLLSIANEEESEKYAEIISKINQYSGEKLAFREEMVDKIDILEKLEAFLNRNNKILLEMHKQEGENVVRGVKYYTSQLKPFEEYVKRIEKADNFDEYQNLLLKIEQRLDALELSLDSSINVVNLLNKDDGLKNVYQSERSTEERVHKQIKEIKKDKFLKRFLYIFLELCPLLFATLLLAVAIFMPKEVYLYFSQEALIIMAIISVAVGGVNFLVFYNSRRKATKIQNIAKIVLFAIGILNLILLCLGFYLVPKAIEINNVKEFEILTQNASYSNFVLTKDIDMNGKTWARAKFSGTLDGQGHTISNLKFADKKDVGLFNVNRGEIKNLNINLAEITYKNAENFGALSVRNYGKITNCKVEGNITFNLNTDASIGGLVSILEGGDVESCQSNLTITISITDVELRCGGIIGEIVAGKDISTLSKNENNSIIRIVSNSTKELQVGGLVGKIDYLSSQEVLIEQNKNDVDLVVSGTTDKILIGGLAGYGAGGSSNNSVRGKIDLSALTGNGYMGGLYGEYNSSPMKEAISKNGAILDIVNNTTVKYGSLVGLNGGKVEYCFTNSNESFYGDKLFAYAEPSNCFKLTSSFYNSGLNLDTEIWNMVEGQYPTLK